MTTLQQMMAEMLGYTNGARSEYWKSMVEAGAYARAYLGTDYNSTRIAGKVIGYSNEPMVLIEDAEGNREWWVQSLTEASTLETET